MKKIKLLAPILGMTAVAGTVVPMASCTWKQGSVVEIKAVNVNEETARWVQIDLDKTEAKTDEDLLVKVSWFALSGLECFSNQTSVKIGDKVYVQQSPKNPNGFSFVKYFGNGFTLSIPHSIMQKSANIEINVDLQYIEWDGEVGLQNYYAEGVEYPSGSGNKYDVISSDDRKGSGRIESIPSGDTWEFSVDLNAWKEGKEEIIGDIYFIIGEWDSQEARTGGSIIQLNPQRMGKLYMGDFSLEYSLSRGIIQIKAPYADGKWKTADQTQMQPISGSYHFIEDYEYVEFMIGQEADEQ